MNEPIGVLMVCLGNICRSPTAHGIFEALVKKANLETHIFVDSAGTSGWHIGAPPDQRSQAAALKRGYNLSRQTGRQVTKEDFAKFDYILAMDADNLHNLKLLQPSSYAGHLGLFLEFATQTDYDEVPDPYHGGTAGFELVLDLLEDASKGLLRHIQQHHT